MRKLFPLASTLLVCTIALPSFGNSELDPIAAADWRVDAKPSVVERSFNKKAVALFVDNFRGVDIEDPELAEPPAKPEQVGDFKWLDIDKDGVYELFVTFAETRAFYGGPTIYRSQGGKKVVLQAIPGWPAKHNIADSLQDLDRDGTPELLISQYLTHYRGAVTSDIWAVIYQWDGQRFEDASANFEEYYLKRLLPQVEERIREISAQSLDLAMATPEEQAHYELRLAMQQVVRGKILRFTGQDSRAGIDLARAWAKSENRELKTLAIDVFKDAGLSTYVADIQLLTSDPDPYVSSYAKRALATRSGK